MKKKSHPIPPDRSLKMKEISDGVYINLNQITSDQNEFDKAIEESFKELKKEEDAEKVKDNSKSTQSTKRK